MLPHVLPLVQLLLIEDTPDDARLLQEFVQNTQKPKFVLTWTRSLSSGLEHLAHTSFDIILLDLHLPDSVGRHTFTRAHRLVPHTPIIILSGTEDETLAIQVVRDGAQDYLLKGQVQRDELKRAINYAIERQRLLNELDTARQREQEAREILALEQLSQLTKTTITAQLYGLPPLRESAPDVFNLLMNRYQVLMENALEHRIYHVDQGVSKDLRTLADQLGFLKAGPRDVIELHTQALKSKINQVPLQKAQAYVEEGRLMVLELMGYLVTFYRSHAVLTSPSGEVQ
ncbi:MAG: response regulator [Anaerolineales bacterium]|jgi:DNA-binding NarL/FixJ family response regulator|nr:response regulator [Anaerolineales bacterium]